VTEKYRKYKRGIKYFRDESLGIMFKGTVTREFELHIGPPDSRLKAVSHMASAGLKICLLKT
jgi:hypothetical protein